LISRRRIEVGLLVALCFFLPLLEAPKNILIALYLIVWVLNRVHARNFGGRWDTWDALIAVWIASGYVVALFAGIDGAQWRGASDLLRYGVVLWLVKRSRFTLKEIHFLLGALIASTLIGLFVGYATWRDVFERLKLHSVGHVNHTAIYLAIMLGVCASYVFTYWSQWSTYRRLISAAIALFVLASIVVAASRSALLVSAVMLMAVSAGLKIRWPSVAIVTLVATLSIATVSGAWVVEKHMARMEEKNLLAGRDGIWRAALLAWERYPIFGVGMRNYNRLSPDQLRDMSVQLNKPYDASRYETFTHGHSLYFNTLAERGIVGFVALGAVLVAWIVTLLRRRPSENAPKEHSLLWGCALGAWIVSVGVGFFNTTLHHEHAILAVLLLGLWLSECLPSAQKKVST
jgi:O-antigen ligase